MSDAHLHVLILAAGASTRLGSPKQLVHIAGKPALAHAIGHATAVAGNAVTVILGAHAAQITPMLQRSATTTVINRQWCEGMAASLRCGVQSLSSGCDAVLVLLGDQVAVTANDLRRLIAAWNGSDSLIAASLYQGQLGVPAIFPRCVFNDLLALRGDQGAKLILNRYMSRLIQVPIANAAHDLDTLDDVAAMQARLSAGEEER